MRLLHPIAGLALIASLLATGCGSAQNGTAKSDAKQDSQSDSKRDAAYDAEKNSGASAAAIRIGSIDAGADGFRVLAGSTVTSVGPTAIDGNVGLWPGTAVTGFGPGTMTGNGGHPYATDAAAERAQSDLTAAFDDAAGRPGGTAVSGNLGGKTLSPGIYTSTSSLEISSGDLTLHANGDPNAVFIFQIPSALTVTSGRRVVLTGGAKAANVFWMVGSSATLGTTSDVSGTIMAKSSVSLKTGSRLHGRALARSGAVTLDASVVGP